MKPILFASLVLSTALYANALPALAGECDQWSASEEETEGGPEMVARTCMKSGDSQFELSIMCGAPGQVNMRLYPVVPDTFPPTDGYQDEFSIAVDGAATKETMVFEEMDAALAAYIDVTGSLFSGMNSGKSLTITDSKGLVPASTYTLTGAKDALMAVMKTRSME